MKKLWSYIRHNPCITGGFCCSILLIFYAYSCQSMVVSVMQHGKKITRQQLVLEVDTYLDQAELLFADLDRQDMVRDTIFNSVLDLAKGKDLNPVGILTTLAGIIGLGAIGDNIKKRTHINTLKGNGSNVKKTS